MPPLLKNACLARLSILAYIALVRWTLTISAKAVNVTVDDEDGDPITDAEIDYELPSGWQFGPNCTSCEAAPDPSQAYLGTWHEATYNTTSTGLLPEVASFNFTGEYIPFLRDHIDFNYYHRNVCRIFCLCFRNTFTLVCVTSQQYSASLFRRR